eukprot:14972.XXX_249511_249675_1 [CDS] Oithona nana genome sequencing.
MLALVKIFGLVIQFAQCENHFDENASVTYFVIWPTKYHIFQQINFESRQMAMKL